MNRVKDKKINGQGHRDHGQVKYELNQALVMIILYVKFNRPKLAMIVDDSSPPPFAQWVPFQN